MITTTDTIPLTYRLRALLMHAYMTKAVFDLGQPGRRISDPEFAGRLFRTPALTLEFGFDVHHDEELAERAERLLLDGALRLPVDRFLVGFMSPRKGVDFGNLLLVGYDGDGDGGLAVRHFMEGDKGCWATYAAGCVRLGRYGVQVMLGDAYTSAMVESARAYASALVPAVLSTLGAMHHAEIPCELIPMLA